MAQIAATSATTPPAAPPTKPAKQPEAPAPTLPRDVVRLSSAAQSALQEASETPAQTAKEAAAGDAQARRLLSAQASAKKVEIAQTPLPVAV
jgi:hypothetical protein